MYIQFVLSFLCQNMINSRSYLPWGWGKKIQESMTKEHSFSLGQELIIFTSLTQKKLLFETNVKLESWRTYHMWKFHITLILINFSFHFIAFMSHPSILIFIPRHYFTWIIAMYNTSRPASSKLKMFQSHFFLIPRLRNSLYLKVQPRQQKKCVLTVPEYFENISGALREHILLGRYSWIYEVTIQPVIFLIFALCFVSFFFILHSVCTYTFVY